MKNFVGKNNQIIILEIGLNHLGETNYLKQIVKEIIKLKVKNVTIQFRNKKYYFGFKKKLLLSKNQIDYVFKEFKSNKIKVGLAIEDYSFVEYIGNNKPDFFKILSYSYNNLKLIEQISKFNKKIYISLGLSNINSTLLLDKKLKKIINNYNYVYTSLRSKKSNFEYKILEKEINEINLLQKKLNRYIAYGQHHRNNLPIYSSYLNGVREYFIYYVSNKKRKHRDQDHSYDKNDFTNLQNELKKIKKDMT